jgi:hypothetical protein
MVVFRGIGLGRLKMLQPVVQKPKKAKLIDTGFSPLSFIGFRNNLLDGWISDIGYFNGIGLLLYQSTSATKVLPVWMLNNGSFDHLFFQDNYGFGCVRS